MFLNENIYNRFGINVDIKDVQKAFVEFIFDECSKTMNILINYHLYESSEKLYKIRENIIDDSCYSLLINRKDLNFSLDDNIQILFKIIFNKGFLNGLCGLQILFNVFYKHKFIKEEFNEFVEGIEKYTSDWPNLGIIIKRYKTMAPQILPFSSDISNKNIDNTLNLLESKKFVNTIASFENGLKVFLLAKTFHQFKDVVEDMHGACDEVIKEITGQKNKSFSGVFGKTDFPKYGLNNHSKEIYRNLKDRMDSIKHGSLKELTKNDVWSIVDMTSLFIQTVVNNYK